MAHQVKEYMTQDPVLIPENMPLEECENLLLDNKISGAPVVDGRGKLVGVISKTDFSRKRFEERHDEMSEVEFQSYEQTLGVTGLKGFQVEAVNPKLVTDIMTRRAIVCSPDDTMVQAAEKMVKKHIHRLIVTENFKVVGILSTTDILSMVCGPDKTSKSAF